VYQPRSELLEAVGISPEEAAEMNFRRGRGCRVCQGRGISGRTAVFEILMIDEDMRSLILKQASEDELFRVARERGMITLREAALRLVRTGVTTLEEMWRVVLTRV